MLVKLLSATFFLSQRVQLSGEEEKIPTSGDINKNKLYTIISHVRIPPGIKKKDSTIPSKNMKTF